MAKFCEFRTALTSADDHIKLEWTGYESQREATDPIGMAERDEGQVHFLDLYMWAQPVAYAGRTSTTHMVMFRPYSKQETPTRTYTSTLSTDDTFSAD